MFFVFWLTIFLIIEEGAGIKGGLKSLKHFSLNQQENDHPFNTKTVSRGFVNVV